ncbi:MAG: hypothetical protein O3B05_06135 [archaeon]|nr:hypothetical protein [archaeon]
MHLEDPVAKHLILLGFVPRHGAVVRAIAGGAAPRHRDVGLALLRADLRAARRALNRPLRGAGWYDWRDLAPHVVAMAQQRARRLRLLVVLHHHEHVERLPKWPEGHGSHHPSGVEVRHACC